MFLGVLSNHVVTDVLNCEVGNRFLVEIAQLFTLLRALGRYPVSQDYEDERTSATLTLISYLFRTERFDMYINQVSVIAIIVPSLLFSSLLL